MQYEAKLLPSKLQLERLSADFKDQMVSGLSREVDANGKALMMLPSYVTRLPDG